MPPFAWALTIIGAIGAIVGIVWFIESRFRKTVDPAVVERVERKLDELRTEVGQIAEYLDGLPQAPPKIKDPFTEGMAHKEKYEYGEAIRLFRQALAEGATGSQKAALLGLIGGCFYQQGELEEAEGHYKEAEVTALEAHDQMAL